MKGCKPLAFACGLLLAAAGPVATAAAQEGFYASGFGGATFLFNSDVKQSTPTTTTAAEIEHETGFMAGGAVGYAFLNGLRLEIEGSYRENDLDSFQPNGGTTVNADGSISAIAGMLNAYYDVSTGGPFVPYIGGGIGAAVLSLDDFSTAPATPGFSDTDTQFAFQGMAGVGYKLTPNITVGVEYRYFQTLDPDFSDTVAGIDTKLRSEYQTHNVMGRITIHFGK